MASLALVEEAAQPPGLPEWIERSLNVKPGRDPIGLQTITLDRIMPILLPGGVIVNAVRQLILAPGEGLSVENPMGGLFTFKITSDESDGALTAIETFIVRQEGPPLHVHDQDEVIYTLEGSLRVKLGDPCERRQPYRLSSSRAARRIPGRTSALNRCASSRPSCRRRLRSKSSSSAMRSWLPRSAGRGLRPSRDRDEGI